MVVTHSKPGSGLNMNYELKGKWWYRLLRVVLIPLYMVVLLEVLGFMYDLYRPHCGT
jgi:hypothetical protein